MGYAVQALGEAKARIGVASVLSWVAQEPLQHYDLAPAAGPSLTVHLPSGDVVIGGVATVYTVATAVSADRRTLTISGALPEGYAARGGEAWLSSEAAQTPVRIVSATGAVGVPVRTVELAEALPRVPQLEGVGNAGTLVLSRYEWTLPAATVCAAAARNVRWTVTYTAQRGASGLPEYRQETGLLHVVAQPFSTGLTVAALGGYVRELAGTSPRGERGWEHALSAGEEELILWLRSQLKSRGLTEDDVPAPQSLRLAHAHFAAASALGLADLDVSDRLRDRGTQLATTALEAIWVDSDQDGEVDDGEVQQITGNKASDWRGSAGVRSASRLFRIGGSH